MKKRYHSCDTCSYCKEHRKTLDLIRESDGKHETAVWYTCEYLDLPLPSFTIGDCRYWWEK